MRQADTISVLCIAMVICFCADSSVTNEGELTVRRIGDPPPTDTTDWFPSDSPTDQLPDDPDTPTEVHVAETFSILWKRRPI